jgi:putative FmdB family regulatory protein
MPLYEYECAACGHRFERIQKFSDLPVEICPNCGEAKVQKLVSSPAIQFKGSGWYITDYAKKGSAGTDSKSGAAKESGDSKDSKESRESKESGESGKSKESKESKESKPTAPAAGTSSPAKASGE